MRWSTAIVLLFLSTLPLSFANVTYFNTCVCALPRYHPFTCLVPFDNHTCPDDPDGIEPLPAIPVVGSTVDDASLEPDPSSPSLVPETLSPPLEPSPTPQTMPSTDSSQRSSSSSPDPSLPFTSSSASVPAPSFESQQGNPGIFLSFEEWRKRLFDIESKKTRKRVNAGGNRKGRQQIIDSLDGGLGDDVGSLFERHDYDTPQAFYESKQLSAIIPEKGSVDGLVAPAAPNPAAADANASPYANNQGEDIQLPARHAAAESSSSSLVARPSDGSAAKPRSAPTDNINLLKKLKERYNYASIDCAATVLSVNREARGASTILYESKDRYMLNECSARRFVIVGLCESILIDTIVMANYEFFSSTFRDFRVWVAEQYPPEEQVPPKEWELLGQWRARNTRDVQIFDVPNQEKWWRYIKVEFLSHYSHEYFCPLSLIRVHGSPQMEFFNLYEKPTMSGTTSDDDDSDEEESSVTTEESAAQDRLLPAELEARMNQTKFVLPPITTQWIPEDTEAFLAELMAREAEDTGGSGEQQQQQEGGGLVETEKPAGVAADEGVDDVQLQQDHFVPSTPSAPSTGQPDVAPPASTDVAQEAECEGEECTAAVSYHDEENGTMVAPSSSCSVIADPSASAASATVSVSANTSSDHGTSSDIQPSPANLNLQPIEEPVTATTIAITTTTATMTITTTPSSPSTASAPSTAPSDDAQLQKLFLNAYNPQPTGTGESIYKTIMKRLGMLELNVTLSQRYLEDQNKMLHGVFTHMEQTHREQMHMLAGHLNETGALRVEALKRRYEQQREETISEIKELTTKLHIMADQLVFEKRLALVQLILLVCLFVFLAMTRGTLNAFSPIVVAQAQERRRREAIAVEVHLPPSPKDGAGVLSTAEAVKNVSTVESVAEVVELKQNEPETKVAADTETKVTADVEKRAETEARRAEEQWGSTSDGDAGREAQARTQVQAQDGSDQYEAVVPVAPLAVGSDSRGVQPELQQRFYNHVRQESEIMEDLSSSTELPAQSPKSPDRSVTPPPKSPDSFMTPPPKSPDGSMTPPPSHGRNDHAFDTRDDDVPLLESEPVPHPDAASFARRYHERMAESEGVDHEARERVETTGEQCGAMFLPLPFEDGEQSVEAEFRAEAGAGTQISLAAGGAMHVDDHELPVTPSALLERAGMAAERFELRGEERTVPEEGWPGL
ncbi:UNC-like C-terminal-domain-containing protein [Endogone sp. FLAS-F59071]|nr:UNC-like C-terminal-domain-containing protein [Endogone sp. FLAS-F59071]|eukprot:RUS16354.1 UNC-like C-terminal-domain-containing protein [Endogone sp. FLAS-F59071]